MQFTALLKEGGGLIFLLTSEPPQGMCCLAPVRCGFYSPYTVRNSCILVRICLLSMIF